MVKVVTPTRKREHAYSLTSWEWVALLSGAAGITFKLLSKTARSFLHNSNDGLTFHQCVAYEAVRDYQRGLSAVNIQNVLPSTSKTCQRFAKRHGIQQSEIQLPDGTIAQWLGRREAPKLVVLFHGGGYMSPALTDHVYFAFGFAKPDQNDYSVVVLQYSLASENANHYPCQLKQAVALIEHLLHSEKVSPSAITLVGDSAGGNLLLGLILHIRHPNPLVSPLKVSGQFFGAILISPWVTINTSAESIKITSPNDILDPVSLAYWAKNFLGEADSDSWNTPSLAPMEWWSDLPVGEMLVLYGDGEILKDDISMLCEKLKSGHVQTTALSFPGEIHVQMIMNRFLQINTPSKSEKVFVDWVNSHLRSKVEN